MFYKNNNGTLLNGSMIENKYYRLSVESRNSIETPIIRIPNDNWENTQEYKTPIDGWFWFDSEHEARYYLDIYEIENNIGINNVSIR